MEIAATLNSWFWQDPPHQASDPAEYCTEPRGPSQRYSTSLASAENDGGVSCPDPDLDYVVAAQRGELDAFDELVRRHQGEVSALLFRFCPSRLELEDLVQEVFIRAFNKLGSWQPQKPFLHWLKKVAVNVGREYYRSNQRSAMGRRVAEPIEDSDHHTAVTESTDSQLAALEEVQWWLSHLDADDRTLLTLLYLQQETIAAIAGHFGWSQSKTKIKAHRARKRLKTILEKYDITKK